ncbi:MAG: amidohydrolase family protein [Anaerolineae bacterium]
MHHLHPMLPPYPVIDAHVHIMPWDQVHPDAASKMNQRPDMDEIYAISSDPHRLIAYMDERNVEKLAMINYITPTVVGFTEGANRFSAEMARPYPDRLIPFGGIDPRRVADVAAEMDYLLGELRLRGIKLHPPHQLFRVNDYLNGESLRGLATVYEKCIAYNVPVMVHTGTSVFPRARNKYGRPLDIDDVLVDFPELKVIIAHGGRPLWMDEAFFILRRSKNAYLDISSIPPKNLMNYFPWIERVADQTMFGSDWPGPGVPDLRRNIEDFYALPLSDETKRKVLRETAAKLFS